MQISLYSPCMKIPPLNSKEILSFLRTYILINILIAASITVFFNADLIGSVELFYQWEDFTYAFFVTFLISTGVNKIIELTDRKISWVHEPVKRFFIELTFVVVYSFFCGLVVAFVYYYFVFEVMTLDNIPWRELIRETKSPIYISLFITVVFTSRSFLMEWRKEAIASEKLRADRFQGQYQSLKNQLNPHFLFNSLNTLTNLVYEDQDKAAEFIRELSSIYRYVLEVQKEELVSLEEELKFLDSYLGLQKLRFGDKLQVNISVQNTERLVPPLTLQLLLENAIKHNVVSASKPLSIQIEDANDYLTVENNLNRKKQHEESTGIGLENIKARLSFFSTEPLEISETEAYYRVKVPLLKSKAVNV